MNQQAITTIYLGDGVYVNVGRFEGEIILTTGRHYEEDRPTEYAIYLDPSIAHALHLYLKRIFESAETAES